MTTKSEVMEGDYPKIIGILLVVASVCCIIVLFIADKGQETYLSAQGLQSANSRTERKVKILRAGSWSWP